jgi:lipid-binding SYLF domain-containing protein
MSRARRSVLAAFLVPWCWLAVAPAQARAASDSALENDANMALQALCATEPQAAWLAKRAKAFLVFPRISKGAFIVGGHTGNGVLLIDGRAAAYYRLSADWFGLLAGGKPFSYTLFFTTDSALKYLTTHDQWTVGGAPRVFVVRKGIAGNITGTTRTQDVYAFPFGQGGLMDGPGLTGTHIARYTPRL